MSSPQKNCAFHPNKTLVNFCRNPECLLPMCPSCIKVHTAEHTRLNTHANYDYLPDLYTQIQTQLSNTLKNVLGQGEQLQQVVLNRQNQRTKLVSKMKQTRNKILEQVNKYIDSIQQQFLNVLSSQQQSYSQHLAQISTSLTKLTEQIQSEIKEMSSDKSLKTLIYHISANMGVYYGYSVAQIGKKIEAVRKDFQIVNEKEFKINEISEFLKDIGICYTNIFGNRKNGTLLSNKDINIINSHENMNTTFNVTSSAAISSQTSGTMSGPMNGTMNGTLNGTLSGTMNGNYWMMNSSISNKSRECSTQGSFKKVI